MSDPFYARPQLYDRLFPGMEPAQDFYRDAATRQGGRILELGCGTGQKLIPIAADGLDCTGLELSPQMLAEARRKAGALGVDADWVRGDMRTFDLDGEFDFIFIAANSLLHLHRVDDLLDCFRSVLRHLAPHGRLIFDVFNPNIQMLAAADGERRRRDAQTFVDPERGVVHVDVADTYDAAAQIMRGTWYFSTETDADFLVIPLELRAIFPQELGVLLGLAGLRLVERFGDWTRGPFRSASRIQLCVCEAS